jgi:hypothetical protein
MRDHYATLQVDPQAEQEVIEAAYRRLARKWHPDVNRHPEAERRTQELNDAYAVLGDPARRRTYDATRSGPPAPGWLRSPRQTVLLVGFAVCIVFAVLLARALGPLVRVPIALLLIGGGAYALARLLGRGGAGRRGSDRDARTGSGGTP